MSIVKTLRFGVQAHWFGGRLVRLGGREKPPLRVATPPEFEDGVAGSWSPEELLVGAVGACYELTLAAIAERRGIPLHTLEVDARGHVERRSGRYGFTVIELDVELTTDPGRQPEAEEAARVAEAYCIVQRALDVPVHARIRARALSPEPAVS